MKRTALVLVLGSILVVIAALYLYIKTVSLPGGVYQLGSEVSGFSGETLELNQGRFRYWFYSDVVMANQPSYPLSGNYIVFGNTLILLSSAVHDNTRTIATLNGVNVLWRGDGLRLWNKEKRVQPYAILIQNPLPVQGEEPPAPPSVDAIYTQEMRDADKKRFQERFSDQPVLVRSMLRARTANDDPDLFAYRRTIHETRLGIDPKLVKELVAFLGYNSGLGVDAERILNDIYCPTHLIPEEPSFRKSNEDFHRALDILIDSFSAARDRSGLEEALLVFLRASKIFKMSLEIPDGGVRIRVEATGDGVAEGGSILGSENWGEVSKHPRDHNWTEKMSIIIPACQQWARDQTRK
jgi:hypothetical protein